MAHPSLTLANSLPKASIDLHKDVIVLHHEHHVQIPIVVKRVSSPAPSLHLYFNNM